MTPVGAGVSALSLKLAVKQLPEQTERPLPLGRDLPGR